LELSLDLCLEFVTFENNQTFFVGRLEKKGREIKTRQIKMLGGSDWFILFDSSLKINVFRII
jgi:hypothetical protein